MLVRGLTENQLAAALEVLGDRWVFLVLRDAFLGVTRFDELHRRTGAPRSTLTARLRALVDDGILYRNPYQSSPRRYEYRLTGKGLELYPATLAAWVWERRWSDAADLPPRLEHLDCGRLTHPRTRCVQCLARVDVEDCTFEAGPARGEGRAPSRYQRRSKPSAPRPGVDESFFHTADIAGDRWTALVFSAAMFGVCRYDEFVESLGIATNILAERLKLLTRYDVLSRELYQNRPKRYEYRLTRKGRELFPFVTLLAQWGEHWLAADVARPIVMRHTRCGRGLVSEVVCDHCEGRLYPSRVAVDARTRLREVSLAR